MIQFQLEPEGLGIKRAGSVSFSPSPSLKAGKIHIPALRQLGRERELSLSHFFCSAQASHGLDQTHPHQRWQSALLTLPIQTFCCCSICLVLRTPWTNLIQKYPQRDTESKNVKPDIRAPPGLVKWIHKISKVPMNPIMTEIKKTIIALALNKQRCSALL